jgi:hypothetical protein
VVRSAEPDDEDEVIQEPVKRVAKKEEVAVEPKKDLASIIDAWGDDDEG